MKSRRKIEKIKKVEVVDIHLNGMNLATCDGCTGSNIKKKVILKGNPDFCPDCGYALFYERVKKAS